MKNLYSTLNEGILDVDDVINQLEDDAELGCLEKIFKLVGEAVDDQRHKYDYNRWHPASPTGAGKEATIYLDQDKYQELLKLIHQFIGIANGLKITPEQSEVIGENPKEFIIGHVHEIQGGFKLELLIPQGSKFVLYSIVSIFENSRPSFMAAILPVDSSKKSTRWSHTHRGDVVKNMADSKDGNFVIPCSKTIKRRIKGFLYNFDGYVRFR